MPSKRLFLGNLSFYLTTADLKQHLDSLKVSATEVIAIINPDNGRCRGFGFAEFPSESSASSALAAINSSLLEGRPIRADYASERNRGRPHQRPTSANGVPASDVARDLRRANPPPGAEYRGNGKDRKPQNLKGRKPMKHRQRETSSQDVWNEDRRRR